MVQRPRSKAKIAKKKKRCSRCGTLVGIKKRCTRCHGRQ